MQSDTPRARSSHLATTAGAVPPRRVSPSAGMAPQQLWFDGRAAERRPLGGRGRHTVGGHESPGWRPEH